MLKFSIHFLFLFETSIVHVQRAVNIVCTGNQSFYLSFNVRLNVFSMTS